LKDVLESVLNKSSNGKHENEIEEAAESQVLKLNRDVIKALVVRKQSLYLNFINDLS